MSDDILRGMENNPDLPRRLQGFLVARSPLSCAFESDLSRPMPQRLLDTVTSAERPPSSSTPRSP
jgi:hypothetical protein